MTAFIFVCVKITVHRGSHQIGGSCIEIAAGTTRGILDAGLPLDADATTGPLTPPVSGLFDQIGPSVDALFLSHSHADHSGLISLSRSQVPVWLTAGTSKMILAGGLFARQPGVSRLRTKLFSPGVPVVVGSVKVTAYPVDHSVFDAMAFLVEAEGKRLLYTGDLRFHGRKPGMAKQLVRVASTAPLDALIIEGTRIGDRATEKNLSEANLEVQLVEDMHAAPGIVLAMYSPLNVDRFVSYYRAAKKTKRTMVVDPYQAFVLYLIGKQAKLPRPNTASGLRVIVPPRFGFSQAGKKLAHTRWAATLSGSSITTAEIRANPERFVMLFRQSVQPWLYPTGLPQRTTCIFSYWPGYPSLVRR